MKMTFPIKKKGAPAAPTKGIKKPKCTDGCKSGC
jgi:hypothetical protein